MGFLEGDSQLNAGAAFDQFGPVIQGVLRRHMDWWIALKDNAPKKYHGFQEPEFRKLFVFKHVAEGIRLYGFRCHPMPNSNMRHECIALCIFDSKFEDASNKSVQQQVERWRNNIAAQSTIRNCEYFRVREEEWKKQHQGRKS